MGDVKVGDKVKLEGVVAAVSANGVLVKVGGVGVWMGVDEVEVERDE